MKEKENSLREGVQMTGRGRIEVEEYGLLQTEDMCIHIL